MVPDRPVRERERMCVSWTVRRKKRKEQVTMIQSGEGGGVKPHL